jgi:glucuronate isomerase
MPCNSDYMNPTGKEVAIKRTATLLVYALTALGQKVPTDIKRRADNLYGADSATYNSDRTDKARPTRNDDSVVALLCKTVKGMSDDERERVIYNAHDATARDLASWVEEHERADRERLARENAAKERDAARRSAKAKLSPAERRAVGL